MPLTSSTPGRTSVIDHKEYLYFSGTAYLGIPHSSQFRENLYEGLHRYGSNYSSSRISNLKIDVFEKAEKFLADFIGTEACITTSSGFLAGKMLLSYLRNKGNFIYAPNAHPALIQNPEDFTSNDMNEWVNNLSDRINNCTQEEIFIICNSVDPLFAQKVSFSWINDLPLGKKISIVIDDSHGLGIIGEKGNGIYSMIKQEIQHDVIIVSSMGKALGIPGGLIAGNKKLISSLEKTSAYGSSSPIIPAYLHAFLNSERLYQQAREKLFKNIDVFSRATADLGLFNYQPGFPVFYTSQNTLYNHLFSKRIIISCFPYPSPQDQLVTRIIINSMHETEDLEKLTAEIRKL